MTSASVELGQIAAAAQNFNKAYGYIKQYISKKNPYPIVLLGTSGAGKTSLINQLSGKKSDIPLHGRTLTIDSIDVKMGNCHFCFIDTPGQTPIPLQMAIDVAQMIRGRRYGIINVVAYGYLEVNPIPEDAIQFGQPHPDYLKACLQKEIDHLPVWTDAFCNGNHKPDWILTVVTKADYWWKPGNHQPAIKHYAQGDFIDYMGHAARINHGVQPYATRFGPFFDEVNALGFYSSTLREAHHAQLMAFLNNVAHGIHSNH